MILDPNWWRCKSCHMLFADTVESLVLHGFLWCVECFDKTWHRCKGPDCWNIISLAYDTCSGKCAARLERKAQGR